MGATTPQVRRELTKEISEARAAIVKAAKVLELLEGAEVVITYDTEPEHQGDRVVFAATFSMDRVMFAVLHTLGILSKVRNEAVRR